MRYSLEDADLVAGAYQGANGYWLAQGGVPVHRIVASRMSGWPLQACTVVHHLDRDRGNNERPNLMILSTQWAHRAVHACEDIRKAGGRPQAHSWCTYHRCVHPRESFCADRSSWNGLRGECREAANEYRKERGLNTDKFDGRARLQQQARRAVRKGLASPWRPS